MSREKVAGARHPLETWGKIKTQLRDGVRDEEGWKGRYAGGGSFPRRSPFCRSAVYSVAGAVVHATPL